MPSLTRSVLRASVKALLPTTKKSASGLTQTLLAFSTVMGPATS